MHPGYHIYSKAKIGQSEQRRRKRAFLGGTSITRASLRLIEISSNASGTSFRLIRGIASGKELLEAVRLSTTAVVLLA
jgi:hypothetical protein